VQNSSRIVTTNKLTPYFLQARCSSCCPVNSVRALKGIVRKRIDRYTTVDLDLYSKCPRPHTLHAYIRKNQMTENPPQAGRGIVIYNNRSDLSADAGWRNFHSEDLVGLGEFGDGLRVTQAVLETSHVCPQQNELLNDISSTQVSN